MDGYELYYWIEDYINELRCVQGYFLEGSITEGLNRLHKATVRFNFELKKLQKKRLRELEFKSLTGEIVRLVKRYRSIKESELIKELKIKYRVRNKEIKKALTFLCKKGLLNSYDVIDENGFNKIYYLGGR